MHPAGNTALLRRRALVFYRSTDKILDNSYSKWSLIIVIIFFGVNLLGTLFMTKLYGKRIDYIDKDKNRWDQEYIEVEDKPSPWPYTK